MKIYNKTIHTRIIIHGKKQRGFGIHRRIEGGAREPCPPPLKLVKV